MRAPDVREALRERAEALEAEAAALRRRLAQAEAGTAPGRSDGSAVSRPGEEEARFRDMADLAPVMTWVTDPDGTCTYLSRLWYDFTGQDEAVALGFGWLDAVHPDDRGWSGETFMTANARREPFRLEYRLRRADGTYRWSIDAARPRFGRDGTYLGYVGSVIDIDDRRAAETAMRASDERYRALFETIEVGFCIVRMAFDADGRAVDYLIEEANPAFVAQTGADVAGRWVSAFAPDLERHWFDTYGRVALTGEPAHFEDYAGVFRRWFDVRALRVGDPAHHRIAIFFTDITTRRRAEEHLAGLVRLSDRTRDLTDTAAIAYAAGEVLGTTLGASLVGYGLVDPDAETVTIERDWTEGGGISLAGTLRFRDYGSYIADLKRGETVVVTDAATDPRTRDHAEALRALGAVAAVNLPVIERGRLVALLYVGSTVSRTWDADELAFIRAVAERTRSAVERARAEAAVRASAVELRLVADALPVLVAFVDRTLTYRFANAAYRDWFGRDPAEVVGRTVPDLTGAAGFAERRPFIARALAGEPVRMDLAWPWTDGRRRIADIRYTPRRDAQGAVDGFYVFVQDVTAQRDAEASLASRAQVLERQVAERTADRNALWQLSRDLMLRCTFEGVITAVNPAWTEMLGWPEDALLGTSLFDLIHPDDLTHTIAGARDISEGISHARFDNRYRAKDGSYRWIAWSTRPSDGLINAVGRDWTAEKEQAEALARTEEALRQSQKMEAVGQLTGGLAHDFNNMLAGIVGSLELMQTRMLQGRMGDLERYIGAAQGAARRAAALTHRLLAFSRRQTLEPKPTDVNRLIGGMTDLVRRTVGPAVAVEVVGAGGLWPTLVDPSQLENALLNLCINARDAMPDGGRIVVETGNRWLDHRAAQERDLEPGQYVSLCVSDNGTGMTPDVVEKAFDPFFTTKPLGEGTGLGLSMIYGFAKQSGGQVRIYSESGEGTMVCIYLPRHIGRPDDVEAVPDLSESARAKVGETVLVVDDEPTVRMLVTEVLEDLGYAAIEAADGASGLKVLQSDVRIDLLVTDVGLPGGMNGRQMVDAARVNRPDLRVLFITGYAENAALNHGHLGPGMQVLTKPFALEALATRIRGIIEG